MWFLSGQKGDRRLKMRWLTTRKVSKSGTSKTEKANAGADCKGKPDAGSDATFINLPGLPIQYEIESGKMKFKYTISKITYDAVLMSQFDFPTAGYRVMTYEENQKLKKGN